MKKTLAHSRELDGLRGLAALAVFILHITNTVQSPGMSRGWKIAERLAGIGSLGVDVFFVLSGFLITSLLLIDRDKAAYFRNFYWKRVLRIQPVYIIHLVAAWFLLPNSKGYVLLALIFIVNFDSQFHVQDVGPAWTLSIEEQFYLIWPQLVRRLSLSSLYRTSIGVMIFSSGLRVGMLVFARHAALRSTWYRFDGLAMGGLLACQWIGEQEGKTPRIRSFLKAFNSTPLLILAIAYEIAFTSGFAGSVGMAILTTNYIVYRAIGYILCKPGSRLFGWMASSPLVFLGSISYSVYMFHTLFLFLYDTRIAPPSLDLGKFFLRAGAVWLTTLTACIVIRYSVELPVQGLRRYVVVSRSTTGTHDLRT